MPENAKQETKAGGLLFSTAQGGHHESYLMAQLTYSEAFKSCHLSMPTPFEEFSPEFRVFLGKIGFPRERLLCGDGRNRNSVRSWVRRLARDIGKLERGAPVYVTYVDNQRLAALVLFAMAGTKLSALHFRLKYPVWSEAKTFREKFRAASEVVLCTAFCLFGGRLLVFDERAYERLRGRLGRFSERVYLCPDPVDCGENDAGVRTGDGGRQPREDRKEILIFGVIDRRKGGRYLHAAMEKISEAARRHLRLKIVGPVNQEYRSDLDKLVERAQSLNIDVCLEGRHISQNECQRYFEETDIVYAAYEGHVGMSSILVRAACAGRPVIAWADGLIGYVTEKHLLGVSVPAGDVGALAGALEKLALASPIDGFREEAAVQFGRDNSPRAFARVTERAFLSRTRD